MNLVKPAKRLGSVMDNKQITVIGPGRMGLGIALAFALKGFKVTLFDGKERAMDAYGEVLKKAKEEIHSNLKLLRRIGYLRAPSKNILSRISFSHELNRESFNVPFIFEAIPEKPELKIELFKKISPYVHPDSILASTTSTIHLKTLKDGFSHPHRLLITHWLNPAFIIPLVEIAISEGTDPGVIDKMKKVLKKVGKTPVVLKDSPGFIVPRIQALAMNEAVRIFEEGVAPAEDIDTAIKTGFAFRLCVLGLLEFVDLGGLDILYYADDFLQSAFQSERFQKPKLVEEKMMRGEIGPRAGKGIYEYDNVDVRALFQKRYKDLIKLLKFMQKNGLL
jgi:3-hydroxybutyryl-CoA dehydrogenase